MLSGVALGGVLAAEALQAQAYLEASAVMALAVAGSRAPDSLEGYRWVGGKRLSLIPHRTITHWPAPWIVLGVVGIVQMPGWAVAGVVAFSLGGLLHLLFDAMTPSGIPLIHPFAKPWAYPLYRSGDWLGELKVLALTWALAAISLTKVLGS